MTAPRHIESIPTVTQPLDIPEPEQPMPTVWFVAATVAGVVAAVTLIVGLVIA
ncbi:hypothetical protein [Microbacterium sp. YY-01]|uniref:hypothetical protein n=1 Tax=Microbacterium sp. YY-01 TaxID=3421634 RepID=UPI003D1768B8